MKKIFEFLSKHFTHLFQTRKTFLISVPIGVSISLAIYLGLLQRHFFSYRYLLYAVLILIFGTFFSSWFLSSVILPKYEKYPKRIRIFLLIITALLSIFLLANVSLQPIYYLLPDTDLEIRFSIPKLENQEEGVRLLWVETGQGYVHYTNMQISGDWERVFGNTIFHPDQNVIIRWTGKVGAHSEIAFRHTGFDQPIEILWNGKVTQANLYDPKKPDILIQNEFHVPLWFLLPFILSFFIAVSFLIFCTFVLLGSIEFKKNHSNKKWGWLTFTIPMLLVWSLSWMIFWPGIMSSDSMSQWAQGFRGNYFDWHSVLLSILLSFLMKIWYSPAFIVILQMLALSISAAWGLGYLESKGVPKIFLWLVSLLFAIFPPNWLFVITIWKDVAYAISFLWFTVIVLKISVSGGTWQNGKANWFLLSFSALLISLFRQNGLYIAAIILFTLPVIFHTSWRKLVLSGIVFLLMFLGIKGPVFSLLEVRSSSSGQTSLFYLHHIAAHLNSDTEFKDDEIQYLNGFLPVEEWDYWCCYVGPISYDRDFQREEFLSNTPKNRELAVRLFLRDPQVDISHMFCSGELAWRFANNVCEMKSTHGINTWSPGRVDWIVKNDMGVEDQSLIPELVDSYVSFLRKFGFLSDKLQTYLLPAFWLFLAVFSVGLAVIRTNNFLLAGALIPITVQSLILLLISFAPAYRYHYGTCLAGIFLLGIAFIPTSLNKD